MANHFISNSCFSIKNDVDLDSLTVALSAHVYTIQYANTIQYAICMPPIGRYWKSIPRQQIYFLSSNCHLLYTSGAYIDINCRQEIYYGGRYYET